MIKKITALIMIFALLCPFASALCEAEISPEDDEPAFACPDDSDPQALIEAAMEVYSWFAMRTLDIDPYMPSADGNLFRVFDDRLNTREKLTSVLREYFSEEIVNVLLTSGVYVEEDGYLYTGMDSRDIDPTIADIQYYKTGETETEQYFSAAVFYSEEEGEITDLREFNFLREKNADDKWVFTDFWFIW